MIASLPFTPSLPQRAAQPDSRTGNADGQAATVPFALALALQGQQAAQSETEAAHAAAIRPKIGVDAKAFSASALLVGTAVAFAAEAGSALSVAEAPLRSQSIPTNDATIRLTETLEAFLTGLAAPNDSAATSPTPRTGPHASPSIRLSATVTGFSPPLSMSMANAAPSRTLALPGEDATEAVSIRSRPLLRAQYAPAGSFAVHWLPVDGGGMRVLVKLTRLADDLRGELETRLRELFGEFGLKLHDLTFHEAGA